MGRSGGVGVGKGGLERETEEILHWRGGGVLCFGRIQWSVDIKGMHMFCSSLAYIYTTQSCTQAAIKCH